MPLRTLSLCLLILTVAAAQAAEPLVVYCGRKEALVAPVIERFQTATGIPLDVRYNNTPALAAQLAAEGRESPADVFYAQDSGYLGALAGQDLLAALPAELLDRVDPRFRDPDGRWIGVTGRLRVLVYDTETVAPEELPDSLAGLADPKWQGRIGWAPGNASFQAHVSHLRHAWGEERTRAWLIAVRDNGARSYPKNSPQVLAADSGEIALGWVNHYYLHQLHRPGFTAANYSFPEAGREGNVLMVSGAGVVATSRRQQDAQTLLAFLTGEEAQRYFSQEGHEYPVNPAVEAAEGLPALADIPLAAVDQRHLTDVGPTLQLLRELGLQ